MYTLELSETAAKFFDSASAKLQKRLDRCSEQIKISPRNHLNVKALKGNYTGQYRYRLGDYRIVYSINDTLIKVLVTEIDHRSKIYE